MTKIKVLIVDDDPLMLKALSAMAEDIGCNVVTAMSGTEALELVDWHNFDAVITDFAMQGMTGGELIMALARVQPELPCILVTGFAVLNEGLPSRLVKLEKPFDQVHLAEAVNMALQRELLQFA